MISRPTAPEPVKAIVCDAGMAHEGRAGVALAGQQADRVGGDAGLAQRADDHEAAGRRLLGRLEHDGVARSPGRPPIIPVGIAIGKFHGAITATTPRGA